MSERLKKYLNSKGFFAVNDKLEAGLEKIILEDSDLLEMLKFISTRLQHHKNCSHYNTIGTASMCSCGTMQIEYDIKQLLSKYENN